MRNIKNNKFWVYFFHSNALRNESHHIKKQERTACDDASRRSTTAATVVGIVFCVGIDHVHSSSIISINTDIFLVKI